MTNKLSAYFSIKMAERSEAKSAKRSFASKYLNFLFLTRSFASRFLLRFAQPFLAKNQMTTTLSLSSQGLILFHKTIISFRNFRNDAGSAQSLVQCWSVFSCNYARRASFSNRVRLHLHNYCLFHDIANSIFRSIFHVFNDRHSKLAHFCFFGTSYWCCCAFC